VILGRDDRGRTRYTSREMLEIEKGMLERAERMTARQDHGVADRRLNAARSQHSLSGEQQSALAALTQPGDLKALVGLAGSGKSRLLAAARDAWEAQGYTVKGAALSGIAAENLQLASGIEARTLASLEYAWAGNRDPLTSRDVLVIDEASMVGTRQFARVLEAADKARAKVVLIGDPEQLQAIEAGAAFRGILAESGVAELTEVKRQVHDWQREATRRFGAGDTTEGLASYERRDMIAQLPTREAARETLLKQWADDAEQRPSESRLILAYTRDEVRELNTLARAWRAEHRELGPGHLIETERGTREFASGDRLYFLRNEKSLGVKNGSLGTIESIRAGILQVKLDATGDRVAVDTRFYKDLDHGYAATVYKAQGATVDRSYVLATSHYDRHATYVALSRHRQAASVFYAAEDFGAPWARAPLSATEARQRFMQVLSRARPKELAHDYLDREQRMSMEAIEAAQQRAAEQWLAEHRARELGERAALRHRRSRSHEDPGPDLDL
jgi:Ti-type conjugative transfer relaxase TraA